MADNTLQSGGDTIATDDISTGVAAGAKVQRIKNGFGADNTYSDVSPTNPLPTNPIGAATMGASTGTITSAASTVGPIDVSAAGNATVTMTGTYVGVTAVFEASDDAGTTWYPIQGVRQDNTCVDPGPQLLTSTARMWNLPTEAFGLLRVRSTAWTSGTVNVRISTSTLPLASVVASAQINAGASIQGTIPSSGTFVTLPIIGAATAVFYVGATAPTGFVSGQCLIAGTWVNTTVIQADNAGGTPSAPATVQAVANGRSYRMAVHAGATAVRVGEFGGGGFPWTISLGASASPDNQQVLQNFPGVIKGAQANLAMPTLDFKDAGRTAVNMYATNVAAGSTGTETAISLTRSAGTAATTSAASFVATSGKTLRIVSLTVASRGHLTPTAQITTFALRLNTAGAVITTSTPLVLALRSATAAVALDWDRVMYEIPGGFEITGNGTIQFGMTANAVYTTNAPTWDVTLSGWEY